MSRDDDAEIVFLAGTLAAKAILHAAGAAEELSSALPAGDRALLLRLLRACAGSPAEGG